MNAKGLTLKRRNREPFKARFSEAFALMKYVNRATGRVEWIWNSRDGVSPFGVDDPLAPAEAVEAHAKRLEADDYSPVTDIDPKIMTHTDWHEDVFVPNFIPTDGNRIFMSWSEAPEYHRAAVGVRFVAYVESHREAMGDEQAEKMLAGEAYGYEPDSPTLVIVSKGLEAEFHALASTNPFVPPPAPTHGLVMPGSADFDDLKKPLRLNPR